MDYIGNNISGMGSDQNVVWEFKDMIGGGSGIMTGIDSGIDSGIKVDSGIDNNKKIKIEKDDDKLL